MSREGLTRSEVLVVIVIIAILVLMFLPPGRAPHEAYKTACMRNLHRMGLSLAICRFDNAEEWPSAGATNGRRLELLYPAYIDDLGTFDCPAAKGRSPSYDRETKQVLDSDYYLDAWIPAEAGPGRVVLGTSTRTG